jgi:hypothetical protein
MTGTTKSKEQRGVIVNSLTPEVPWALHGASSDVRCHTRGE